MIIATISTCSVNNEVFLYLISGFIGSIIGALLSSFFAFLLMKKEKQYLIDIEFISDKILSPLLAITNELKERENFFTNLIPNEIYHQIDDIMNKNICWVLCSNNKIKETLLNIKKFSSEKKEKKLYCELNKLFDITEKKLSIYELK